VRLTLITRNRRLVIITGDHVQLEEDTDDTFVSNTGSTLDVAPPEWVEDDDNNETQAFGFQ
jgi:hypothetical protein